MSLTPRSPLQDGPSASGRSFTSFRLWWWSTPSPASLGSMYFLHFSYVNTVALINNGSRGLLECIWFAEVHIHLCDFLHQECLRLRLLQSCYFATRIFSDLVLESGPEHWVVVSVGQKVSWDMKCLFLFNSQCWKNIFNGFEQMNNLLYVYWRPILTEQC